MKKYITILTCTVLLLLVSLTVVISNQQEEVSADSNNSNIIRERTNKDIPTTFNLGNNQEHIPALIENTPTEDLSEQDEKTEKLTEGKIVELTEGFMDTLVAETDKDYRLIEYDTIEELEKAFQKYTQPGVADPYISFYYEEKDGALYIVPTETPPWFVKENDYTLKELSNDKYLLTQTNTIELYGTYTIQIEFELNEGEWKISQILHE
ncbi:hypothetical protein GGQ92_000015 [Gracilibacillus halotolerans]|uniref:Uncharacterized protein n=1 Tax=Gracilibacillus halotolerans TaxID=74386 RepID=A0A841RKH9_9BACI|nr:hypothetical protein [Gracilibacillus halotolerans]MBB6511248.1 hypothetical protein [Gracilibacillus halotolerans]